MAYIGKTPTIGNFQICDAITVVDAQAAYTMQVGGVNVSPESANHMLVSLNGILQAPTSSFTVSGSTITFASNLITGDVIDFVMILGNVLDLGVPSDNTVTTAKLADSSVSLAKLTATGTKNATTFLRGDNTFATVVSGLSEADAYRLAADVSGDNEPIATVNMERVDDATFSKIGTGVSYNTSNGRFTFGATGLYYVEITAVFLIDDSADNNVNFILQGSSDDFSASDDLCQLNFGGDGDIERNTNTGATFFNCTNTSTHKVRINYNGTSGNNLQGSTTVTKTGIRFIRLGDSQ
jgi:hypothetical protein